MKRFFFRPRIVLLTILSLAAILGFALYIFSQKADDFGLNFATEMLGVMITVIVVDYFIKKREDKRLFPMRKIATKEASSALTSFISPFYILYDLSVPDDPPGNFKDFLEKDCISKCYSVVDSQGNWLIRPPEKITDYLSRNAKIAKNKASEILDKYSIYIDPKLSELIYDCLVTSIFISDTIMIPNFTERHGERKKLPLLLINDAMPPSKDDAAKLIELYTFLVSEQKKYLKPDSDFLKPTNTITTNRHKFPYRSKRYDDLNKKLGVYMGNLMAYLKKNNLELPGSLADYVQVRKDNE